MKAVHTFNRFFILLLVLCLAGSCKKVYNNPNGVSESQLLTDPSGLISLVNGTQSTFSSYPVFGSVTASGFTTYELRLLNPGNTDELYLQAGGNQVDGFNGLLTSLWSQCNVVGANSEKLIANAGNIPVASLSSGVKAYGYLFKALSLGTMATFWDNVPLLTADHATFSNRLDALNAAIGYLKQGEALTGNIGADFYSLVPKGIDLTNTFPALEARYYTMIGDNVNALAAAGKVNLSAKSYFMYDAASPNPIYYNAIASNNVFQPIDDTTLGLPPSLAPARADKRIGFYTSRYNGNAGDVRAEGFSNAVDKAIPVYLPGEMILIKAEAYARQNDLANAVLQLNLVLTKTTDAYGIGASLAAYAGANTQSDILLEIYKNRCIELYMSGLKLEDSRRFGRPGPETNNITERNRTYYPFPSSERSNNSNTSPDPAF